jgi:signal transduction histidine kinase
MIATGNTARRLARVLWPDPDWARGRGRDRMFWRLALSACGVLAVVALAEAAAWLGRPAEPRAGDLALLAALAACYGVLAWVVPRVQPGTVRLLRHLLLLATLALIPLRGVARAGDQGLYATGLMVIALAAFLTSPWLVVAYTVATIVLIALLDRPAAIGALNLGTVAVTGAGTVAAAFIFAQAQGLARQRNAALQASAALLERRVAERTAALEHSNRTLRDFMAAVTHELRGPLSNIRAYAEEELAQAGAGGAAREALEVIVDEADVLAEHVAKLALAAQIDADALAPACSPLAPDELVAEAVAVLRGRFRLAGRPLQLAVPAGLPAVCADERFARIVLTNLLDNAHKYSPPYLPVEVSARLEQGGVAIAVRDHGPGVAPDDRERIFERFARGRAAGLPGGLGLGLAICRELARRQHGDVTLGEPGADGATFVFRLPLADGCTELVAVG